MYDAIVVGARCAGSPTAMLLARKGYRVLLRRPGRLPERHALDPLHPPAGRRLPRSAGACCEAVCRLGLPAVARTDARRRPVRAARHAAAGRTASPTAYSPRRTGPRQDPRRRRRRRPARRCASASRSTSCVTEGGRVVGHPRPTRRRRRDRHRARPHRHRRRRAALARRARRRRAEPTTSRPALTCAYYTYWSGRRDRRAPSSTRARTG